jgi:tocopherol O-methyltransferase
VTFQLADAMAMPFPPESFDLVWSLESAEHMPDKTAFLQECCRVLRPGGWLVMATWCHRPDTSPQRELCASELRHLRRLSSLYHLPAIISLPSYRQIAEMLPLDPIRTADWSEAVAPFWKDVLLSALRPGVLMEVLRSGGALLEGLWAVPLMMEGYRSGLIRYGLLAGRKVPRKPASPSLL